MLASRRLTASDQHRALDGTAQRGLECLANLTPRQIRESCKDEKHAWAEISIVRKRREGGGCLCTFAAFARAHASEPACGAAWPRGTSSPDRRCNLRLADARVASVARVHLHCMKSEENG